MNYSRNDATKKQPYSAALLLVQHEDLATVDRRALREAGIRNIKIVSSGVEAARFLAAFIKTQPLNALINNTDLIVLCHERLADMTGDEFIRLVRLHPLLIPFPILITLSTDTPETRKHAKTSGYSGVLFRPYPQDALLVQINHAAVCQKATAEALHVDRETLSTSAFEAGLDYFFRQSFSTSQDSNALYRNGINALKQKQWDMAITCLQRASKLDMENPDIKVALAAACRAKGDKTTYTALIQEAIALFVDKQNWNQVQLLSERLLKEYPDQPHPLQGIARRLLATGRPEEAAHALIRLLASQGITNELSRNTLFEQLARGCAAASNPEQAIAVLTQKLAASGHGTLGKNLEGVLKSRIKGGFEPVQEMNLLSLGDELPSPPAAPAQAPAQANLAQGSSPQTDTSREGITAAGASQTPPTRRTVSQRDRKEDQSVRIPLLQEPQGGAFSGFPILQEALFVARVTLALFKIKK